MIFCRMLKETTQTPIYYYVFNHAGGFSLGDVLGLSLTDFLSSMVMKLLGQSHGSNFGMVSHVDDLLYLFK